MTVATISGIRGIFNRDLQPAEIAAYAGNFSSLADSRTVLVGRDTRTTGAVITKLVGAALLDAGKSVMGYGVISTPALFRESRILERPAIMITASHNEPEWSGLKFVLNGRGVTQPEFDRILTPLKRGREKVGVMVSARIPSYNAELVEKAGAGSCDGVKVAVDLNGGSAIAHAPAILGALGCDVTVLGGTPGVFSRGIDPTNDGLELLARTVKEGGCDVGFAFDCDGDRLVLVDSAGRKLTGDVMLTAAIKEILPTIGNRAVVVSADTTQAVDEVVAQAGGKTSRSRVGEANVISKMVEVGAEIGGEGSSGGLIDSRFNFCRDSMLAALTIVKAIKTKGPGVLQQVPAYHQARLRSPLDRKKALAVIKKLQKENPGADAMDGVKITLSKRSWVLVRESGTEDVIRVSAESPSAKESERLAGAYMERVRSLS